ncbi:MAG: coniferyl aldehyde dehydrogenase [Deltaproteobacteria bacterium]|nr:coniferyl aldehyde dehydrogenase [Deltaproteobacteria bacterium]
MAQLSVLTNEPRPEPAPERAADEVQRAFARLQQGFANERYPSLRTRLDRLTRLERALQRSSDDIVAALDADFRGRSRVESLMIALLLPILSLRHTRRRLSTWMKPEKVNPAWYLRPSSARIVRQPKGVVGVIAPWNYPVMLSVGPMIDALAAGNRVLLKPSELTPRIAEVLAAMLRETFAADEVAVVTGGVDVARAVSTLPLDHLVVTGSTRVGREVAMAAAPNLTPLTLELGGKSPAVVHESYSIERAAVRIGVARLFNAGQTCIAPDYAIVPHAKEQAFVDAYLRFVEKGFGDLATSRDYTAIATERHRDKLEEMLRDAEAKGARVVRADPRGTLAKRQPRMAPALVLDPKPGMLVMEEEIFGPILPVLTVASVEEAIAHINARPRPLAAYYFDDDAARAQDFVQRTHAGGVTLNDAALHFFNDELPFGGVGPSGMGAYHGFTGFKTFSHEKGVYQPGPSARLLRQPFPAVVEQALLALIHGGRSRRRR